MKRKNKLHPHTARDLGTVVDSIARDIAQRHCLDYPSAFTALATRNGIREAGLKDELRLTRDVASDLWLVKMQEFVIAYHEEPHQIRNLDTFIIMKMHDRAFWCPVKIAAARACKDAAQVLMAIRNNERREAAEAKLLEHVKNFERTLLDVLATVEAENEREEFEAAIAASSVDPYMLANLQALFELQPKV